MIRSPLASTSVTLAGVCSTSRPVSTRPSVVCDDVAEVLLADDGAGVDDADEQVVAVVAVGVRQVGADVAALAEELVAGAAVLA